MKNARILVVDDEADIRALVAEILTEEGYSVTTAADATEARSARSESEFELILLDIWMPDIDGITLLKEWNESGLAARVVMMSGHGTVDTAVEATRRSSLSLHPVSTHSVGAGRGDRFPGRFRQRRKQLRLEST